MLGATIGFLMLLLSLFLVVPTCAEPGLRRHDETSDTFAAPLIYLVLILFCLFYLMPFM